MEKEYTFEIESQDEPITVTEDRLEDFKAKYPKASEVNNKETDAGTVKISDKELKDLEIKEGKENDLQPTGADVDQETVVPDTELQSEDGSSDSVITISDEELQDLKDENNFNQAVDEFTVKDESKTDSLFKDDGSGQLTNEFVPVSEREDSVFDEAMTNVALSKKQGFGSSQFMNDAMNNVTTDMIGNRFIETDQDPEGGMYSIDYGFNPNNLSLTDKSRGVGMYEEGLLSRYKITPLLVNEKDSNDNTVNVEVKPKNHVYKFEGANGDITEYSTRRIESEFLGDRFKNPKNGKHEKVTWRSFSGELVTKIPETAQEYYEFRKRTVGNTYLSRRDYTPDDELQDLAFSGEGGGFYDPNQINDGINIKNGLILDEVLITGDSSSLKQLPAIGMNVFEENAEASLQVQQQLDSTLGPGVGVLRAGHGGGGTSMAKNISWVPGLNDGMGGYVFNNDFSISIKKRNERGEIGFNNITKEITKGTVVTNENYHMATKSGFGGYNVFNSDDRPGKPGSAGLNQGHVNNNKEIDWSRQQVVIDYGDGKLTEEDYDNFMVISMEDLRKKRNQVDKKVYHDKRLKKKGYIKVLDQTMKDGKLFIDEDERSFITYRDQVLEEIKNPKYDADAREQLLNTIEEKRKELDLGTRLYDTVTRKLINIEKIPEKRKVEIIEFNKKVEEKTISTDYQDLQLELVNAESSLQSFAKNAYAFIKNKSKDQRGHVKDKRTVLEKLNDERGDLEGGMSTELHEFFTPDELKEYSGSGYESDLKNLKRLSQGRMPSNLTKMAGNHNVAKTYNKLLDNYLVLNRALQLNSDPITREKETGWQALVNSTIDVVGAGSNVQGSQSQIDQINSFTNVLKEAGSSGFQYKKSQKDGIIGENLQLTRMTNENISQMIWGGMPVLGGFVTEVILWNALTGGTFGVGKALTKGATLFSSLLKAKNVYKPVQSIFKTSSAILIPAVVEASSFAGADLAFGGLGITKHHSDPYNSGKSGFFLGIGSSSANLILKAFPPAKFFSPFLAQMNKSSTFRAFQQQSVGAGIGSVSYHGAGVMQALVDGEPWSEATKGLTAKSLFVEYSKMLILGQKNIFTKSGTAHAIRQDYLNFQGKTFGSTKGARFFAVDHKKVVETGNEIEFNAAVKNKKDALNLKLKNKKIDQKQFEKELAIIESNKINVENALYMNKGKIQINIERGLDKNGKPIPGAVANKKTPTDSDIYMVLGRLRTNKKLTELENGHLANIPEGLLLSRSGFTANSPQGKSLLNKKAFAEHYESILDNSQFKTPSGSRERVDAFEFLQKQFGIESNIENLNKQITKFKKENPDNKTGIAKLEQSLNESVKELKEYQSEVIDKDGNVISESGSKYKSLMEQINIKVIETIETNLELGKEREKKLGGKLFVAETAKDFQKLFNKFDGRKIDVSNKVAFYIDGKRVINKEMAIKYKNLDPAKHEDLHFILKDVFKELNKAGETVVSKDGMKIIDDVLSKLTPNQRKIVQKRIDENYRFDGQGKEKNPNEYYEEYLTSFSDAMSNKTIEFTNKFSESLFPMINLFKKKGFENLEINTNTGKNLFELIKTFTESKKLPSSIPLPNTKITPINKSAFSEGSSKRGIEGKIVDNKNTELITKFQSGNKNKIKDLKIIKKILESKGKTTANVEVEIKKLENLKVDASVLPELMKNNIGLVKTFENMFDSKKGGDVVGARGEVRTQIEKLFNTYKPVLANGKVNPVRFGGYAIPIMQVRMANIYDKYSVKFNENVSLESKEVLGIEGSLKSSSVSKVETGKINPLDFVKNSEVNVSENLQKSFDKGIDLQGISSKKLGDISKETTAAIFGIPVSKLAPRENVTFKDVLVTSKMMSNKKFIKENPGAFEGQLIKSEASKIQDKIVSFGNDFMKLLPLSNVASKTASEFIKGTSIGIEPSILKALYKPVLRTDGVQKRSSGKTSQLKMYELKTEFTKPSGYNEFLKIIGKEKGKSPEFDRDIGQVLKSLANMYGRMNTNTFVRSKLQGKEVASVINDIAAGNSKAQFSSETNFNRYREIQDTYKLSSIEFQKAIENPSEIKDLELRDQVTQANFDTVKTTEYAVNVVNKNFQRKFKDQRTNNTKFDVDFAKESGLSLKEAKEALDVIENSSASFESVINGKKVFDKVKANEYVETWTNFYNFMGRGGIEMGTKLKNGLTGTQLEQLFFIGERSTFVSKEGKYGLGPGGLVGRGLFPGVFTLNPNGKVSLKDNPNFSKRTKEILSKIDFSKVDAQNIASQSKLRNTVLKGGSVESVVESLKKQTSTEAIKSLNNFNLFLESAKTDFIESKKGKGKEYVKAAEFLYTSSRMNSNLVKGVRGTYANKYFYVTEGNQGMTMENPIYKGAYNEAITTATKNPKVLTTVNTKGIERTVTIEEYAQTQAKAAAKLKGEHVNDTSTGQLNGWLAQVTGKGGSRVDGMNVKDLIQIASPKKFLDIIDKALGANAEGGLFRMLGDPAVVKVLKNFIDPNGPNLYEVLQKEAAKQVSKNPALANYILNNKFVATDKSQTILDAKIDNIKNTKKVRKNLINTAKKASVFSSEKEFTNEELINKIKDKDNKNIKTSRDFYQSKDLNKDFNDIIQDRTGVESFKTFSAARANLQGKKKGNWDFYVRPAAEDFTGLIYKTLPKGKKGNDAMKWFQENLIDPFTKGDKSTSNERMSVINDYKTIVKENKNIVSTLKKEASGAFTNEQAVRVYNWSQQGIKIPGLSAKDITKLNNVVKNNPKLKSFADQVVSVSKGDGYPKPGEFWLTGTITTDLIAGVGKVKRKKYMEQFTKNADVIYSTENLNKLESQFGKSYREALENIIYRMKTGSNKPKSLGKIESAALEWINGSVGVTMFFNTRSAALQLLSIPNYINLRDNNPFKAGAKFANQKQFWGDFKTLMNSNWAVSRRNGIKLNVTESEIAEAASRSTNKAQGVINYMLEKGFVFTKYADGFATAFGGSTMYRNRIETYKKRGFSEIEAKEKALKDWEEISETTQQSGRTDKISQEQASLAGRLVLAFGNTGMQYTRIPKRAMQDLFNRRKSPGSKTQFESDASNVSKAIYYTTITSTLFVGLQNALFEAAFNPDADIDDKKIRAAENMVDNALRGLGIYGAGISTMRQVASKIWKENDKKNPDYESAAWELLNISPPIAIKTGKFRKALRSVKYDMDDMKNQKIYDPTNPAYLATTQVISGITNLPLDRLFQKVNNLNSALKENRETWQRIALVGGYSDYQLGIEDLEKEINRFKNKSKFNTKNKFNKDSKFNFKSKFQ